MRLKSGILIFGLCLVALPLTAADEAAGIYGGVFIGASSPTGLTLQLRDDHTVKLTQVIIGPNRVLTNMGAWSQANNEVTVRLGKNKVVCQLEFRDSTLILKNAQSDCPLSIKMFRSELPK